MTIFLLLGSCKAKEHFRLNQNEFATLICNIENNDEKKESFSKIIGFGINAAPNLIEELIKGKKPKQPYKKLDCQYRLYLESEPPIITALIPNHVLILSEIFINNASDFHSDWEGKVRELLKSKRETARLQAAFVLLGSGSYSTGVTQVLSSSLKSKDPLNVMTSTFLIRYLFKDSYEFKSELELSSINEDKYISRIAKSTIKYIDSK